MSDDTNFIARYERNLIDAERRRQASARDRLTRSRRWFFRPRALLLAGTAVLVAGPATAATTGWSPFDDPARTEPAPSTSSSRPAPALFGILGVLRRGQTDQDRGSLTNAALRHLDRTMAGVQLGYVRLVDPGSGTVLIPTEKADDGRRDSVCLYVPDRGGAAGGFCKRADDIQAGFALGSQGDDVYGIVPDGVARVELERGRTSTAIDVRENFFYAGPPSPIAPTKARWFDANGEVIRTIDYVGYSRNRPAPSASAAKNPACARRTRRCVVITPRGVIAAPDATRGDYLKALARENALTRARRARRGSP